MKRVIRALALAFVVVLLSAACDSGGDDTADDETPTDETPTDEQESEEASDDDGAEGAEAGVAVQTAETDLGTVLVDGSGMTLYVFDQDDPGVSNCTDGCASTWPPVEVGEDFVVGGGLDAGLFSTVERDDGSLQLAVDGRPLYTYSADSAPGDTNGQGVGDVWFAVTADGERVEGDAGPGASGGLDY